MVAAANRNRGSPSTPKRTTTPCGPAVVRTLVMVRLASSTTTAAIASGTRACASVTTGATRARARTFISQNSGQLVTRPL